MKTLKQYLTSHIRARLEALEPGTIYGCEVTDYLFINNSPFQNEEEAIRFIDSVLGGKKRMIEEVTIYERHQTGRRRTKTDNLSIANAFFHLKGVKLLNQSRTYGRLWDKFVDEAYIKTLINEVWFIQKKTLEAYQLVDWIISNHLFGIEHVKYRGVTTKKKSLLNLLMQTKKDELIKMIAEDYPHIGYHYLEENGIFI